MISLHSSGDASAAASTTGSAPLLVYDGGCPFCRHFAELSELRAGIPGLRICDGRADEALRGLLARRGFRLAEGAVVIDGERVLHGAAAIQWLCGRMEPSAPLLRLLAPLLADGPRARRLYPVLLAARRLALGVRGLPVDPDQAAARAAQSDARAEGTGRGW
jgi:hypothetical protein